ncbi:MAG TPA: TIGR01212 family radical SAM protein [Salinivirgaceae bacterium]|nr:TIGR01212 family radical SAM protein [Salinivirgaceae bacterium]
MNSLPFPIEERFYRYSRFLESKFKHKTQKISINAGFSCPNLDGTIDTKGCIYCNNNSFKPNYCEPSISIHQQIEIGVDFFQRKHNYLYLAYFQSFTNTHTSPDRLESKLMEALSHPKVSGIIVSTRPDCLPPEIIEVLASINQKKPVMVEIGVESTSDETLRFLNRGHTFSQVEHAVYKVVEANLEIGAHLILGLPTENRQTMVTHAQTLSKLPLNSLKLHQLQIVKNTALERIYHSSPEIFHPMEVAEYVELCCDFLEHLRPDIAIERFASQVKPELLVVSPWNGVKNLHISEMVKKRLKQRESHQGIKFLSQGSINSQKQA